jgi:hypothetical protein
MAFLGQLKWKYVLSLTCPSFASGVLQQASDSAFQHPWRQCDILHLVAPADE